jgi:hypothetical protein
MRAGLGADLDVDRQGPAIFRNGKRIQSHGISRVYDLSLVRKNYSLQN